MNGISNVKVHLKTRSGNVNIVTCCSLCLWDTQRTKTDQHEHFGFNVTVTLYHFAAACARSGLE